MGQAFPASPGVVRRSRKQPQRALLAWLAVALIGITVVAVILASNNDRTTDANVASRGPAPAQTMDGQRYDGGPEEGTAAIGQRSAPVPESTGTYASPEPAIVNSDTPAQRYDGGPEEGTAAIGQRSAPVPESTGTYASPEPAIVNSDTPAQRYDGGPEEGTAAIGQRSAPVSEHKGRFSQRYDGGPEEGSAAIGQRSTPVDQTSGTFASPAPSQDYENDPIQDRSGPSR